jgi:hypothetical protein
MLLVSKLGLMLAMISLKGALDTVKLAKISSQCGDRLDNAGLQINEWWAMEILLCVSK